MEFWVDFNALTLSITLPGAVGMGCRELGLAAKPTTPAMKRAVAGAGQSRSLVKSCVFFFFFLWQLLVGWIWRQNAPVFPGIMRLYSELFETVGMKIAQLLVSQRDFLEQQRWAEIRDTINACLAAGVVPVINENDTTNTVAG